MMTKGLVLVFALAALPSPALAENILLTNDDGLTSNVKALYESLKAAGHDVIVAVPCMGQSGMGGAIKFLRPLGPLAADCHNGAARKGDPGAGPMTRAGFEGDYHYVDGTPVMATLYGIDVLAMKRWGRAPDLVLSGPNEGQNAGHIVISSGTVSNVQYSARRGIPSIALSAGSNTADNANLANPGSAVVARLTLDLIQALYARSPRATAIPHGLALNVNFPDTLKGAKWRAARTGTYDGYKVRFTNDLGSTAIARAVGLGDVRLPGIALEINTETSRPDQRNDEAVVAKTDIAVSVLQVGYEPKPAQQKWLSKGLKGLIEK